MDDTSTSKKRGPKTKIKPTDQLFLFLIWLKCGLVGISPSGAITFVSQLYEGSISDKEIVSRSGILTKELWSPGDSLMADRGFDIQDLLSPLQVNLNIPAFLSGRPQLTEAEVKDSQCIASVRIHVERAIQRIKFFRQIRCEVPLSLHGSINQMWTVTCLLCNFLPPLIQKDFPVTETSAPDDVDFTFLSS